MTKEEYAEFFKLTFKEFLEPMAHSHFNVEGTIEFKAMLFVPGMAPFEQQVRLLKRADMEGFATQEYRALGFEQQVRAGLR